MRFGTVPYLNQRLLTAGIPRDRLVSAVPSKLSALLSSGEVDVALLPVRDLVDSPTWVPAGDLGICSDGPVDSVLVVAPLGDAPLTRIICDPASRSSNALARVVASQISSVPIAFETHKPSPRRAANECEESDPRDATTGRIVIGDPALRIDSECRRWDLASLWRDATGVPFVFARWVARDDAIAELAVPQLEASHRAGLARADEIIHAAAIERGLPESLLQTYLTARITYRITREHTLAMARFAAAIRGPLPL
jgi:chorismate dehydratase